jgi:hypothetical protein
MFELRRSGIFRSSGAQDLKGAITTKMALRWSWGQSLFTVFQPNRSGRKDGPPDEGERLTNFFPLRHVCNAKER